MDRQRLLILFACLLFGLAIVALHSLSPTAASALLSCAVCLGSIGYLGRGRIAGWITTRLSEQRTPTEGPETSDSTAAQARLARSEQYLELALRSAQLGVWEWDMAAGKLYFDPQNFVAEQPIKTPPELSIERHRAAIHPEDRERVDGALASHLNGLVPLYECEYRQRLVTGQWKWMHYVGKVVEWAPDGAPRRMTGTYRDATARKRGERALRKANEQLIEQKRVAEEATKAKSHFLAFMSHEIRTPMNGVLGLTEMLLRTPLTDEQREMVETIHGSGEMLLTVLNDILDFSKIEAGKLALENAPFDLGSSVRGTVDLFRAQGRAKGLLLETEIECEAERTVIGDSARVKQIVANLLSNALKFTPSGFVRIAVRPKQVGTNHGFEISVQDTGIGISRDSLDRVFELFAQAETSTTRQFGGTGLGLSIVKRLIELMRGTIRVTSEFGIGSTFVVWLPLEVIAIWQPEPLVPVDARPKRALAGRRILIAEDNVANQLLAQRLLQSAGFDVEIASDGHEALEAVASKHFDLVLMDARMPRVDGFTATRMIRKLPGAPATVPILALTASAFSGDREMCFEAGMNDFLSKPFRGAELVQKCRDWLQLTEDSMPSALPEPAPPFDSERLAHYPASLATDLLEIFLRVTPPRFTQMLHAIAAGQWTIARDAAHYLRGGICGGLNPALERQLRVIETALRSGAPTGPLGDENQLKASFEETLQFAEKWLSIHGQTRTATMMA